MTKSEHARQQIRILEAEWRSGVFQIINSTNMLNDTAVTENKEFRTQIRISEISIFLLCVKSTVSKKKHVWTKLLFLASISTTELLQNDLENAPSRTCENSQIFHVPRPIYSDKISHDQRHKATTKRPQVSKTETGLLIIKAWRESSIWRRQEDCGSCFMSPYVLSCIACLVQRKFFLGDNNHQRAVKGALNNVAFPYGFWMMRSTWQVSRSGI